MRPLNGSKIKSLIYPPLLKRGLNKKNDFNSIYPYPNHSQQTQQSNPHEKSLTMKGGGKEMETHRVLRQLVFEGPFLELGEGREARS